jgi:hypothetical protein
VPDDDLHGWRADAGDAAVVEPLGGASDLVSNRRTAAFLLGVHADVALPIAGIALAICSVRRTTPEQLGAG